MMACSYVPPLIEQLHGPDPTAGSDCAIACAKMAIRFATCGALDPGMDAIREQAGLDEPNPPPDDYSTTMSEYARALNAWDDEAKRAGYEGIGAGVHERESWEDQLAPLIRQEEKWSTVFVKYAIVNKYIPGKSGDKGFGGSHAIGVYGFAPADETDSGEPMVKVFDPLCDARAANIPQGPVWWPMWVLRDAAKGYTGGDDADAVTWCATPRSKLTDPPTEPEPPDPCGTAYASDVSAMLEEARERLLDTRDSRAIKLAAWIRRMQGPNREGVGIRVRPGVKPDGWAP
jgi:hypothetical protein